MAQKMAQIENDSWLKTGQQMDVFLLVSNEREDGWLKWLGKGGERKNADFLLAMKREKTLSNRPFWLAENAGQFDVLPLGWRRTAPCLVPKWPPTHEPTYRPWLELLNAKFWRCLAPS